MPVWTISSLGTKVLVSSRQARAETTAQIVQWGCLRLTCPKNGQKRTEIWKISTCQEEIFLSAQSLWKTDKNGQKTTFPPKNIFFARALQKTDKNGNSGRKNGHLATVAKRTACQLTDMCALGCSCRKANYRIGKNWLFSNSSNKIIIVNFSKNYKVYCILKK